MTARTFALASVAALLIACGCKRGAAADPAIGYVNGVYRGFDRNDYPGDDIMRQMMASHAALPSLATGSPILPAKPPTPGSENVRCSNSRGGVSCARERKLDKEIRAAQSNGTSPDNLGKQDAAVAIAAAKAEGFPRRTILFLDQEEGGRLLAEQAAYLLGWTEAVAASEFRPGVYASGQPVPDGPGKTVDTIQDVRARVAAQHLHPIAVFAYQDSCPPSPGCTLQPKPLSASGESDLTAWQFAQSPRRADITKSCAATYATDNNCYAPDFPSVHLDFDVASSADPSHGR